MYKPAIASIALFALMGCVNAQTEVHLPMDHQKHMATMAGESRQVDVAQRGKDVMPFDLKATTHVFTKTVQGGIQRVVAKKASDTLQVKLVRQHLQEIKEQFLKGDFSGPAHIHGQEMPGLAELKAAKPGQITMGYREVSAGAELIYKTSDTALTSALHQWFDAQVSDHGVDAMAGYEQQGSIAKP